MKTVFVLTYSSIADYDGRIQDFILGVFDNEVAAQKAIEKSIKKYVFPHDQKRAQNDFKITSFVLNGDSEKPLKLQGVGIPENN